MRTGRSRCSRSARPGGQSGRWASSSCRTSWRRLTSNASRKLHGRVVSLEDAADPRPVSYCARSGTRLPRRVLLQPAQCLPSDLTRLASHRKLNVRSSLRDIAPYQPTRTGGLGLRDANSDSGDRGNQRVDLMDIEDAERGRRVYHSAYRATCFWRGLISVWPALFLAPGKVRIAPLPGLLLPWPGTELNGLECVFAGHTMRIAKREILATNRLWAVMT